jgi:integrase/recombinase XerD
MCRRTTKILVLLTNSDACRHIIFAFSLSSTAGVVPALKGGESVMLELYYRYPRVLRRLRSGALGREMDRIAAHFSEIGYKASSVKIFFGHIARFSCFAAKRTKHGTATISRDVVDRFLRTRPTPASRIGASTALCHAMTVASERFSRAPRRAPLTDDDRLICKYEAYLHQVRGLQPKTCEALLLAARRILTWIGQHHRGRPLSSLNGKHVLALVQDLLARCTADQTRSKITTYVRSFLTYLRWAGHHGEDLARFVPHTPCWRLAHLPPRAPWEDVKRAIDRIDVTTPVGVRDRAILLLIATTGLRSKELREIERSDIHWRAGEVLVRRTKTHRDRVVPLLQETGTALAEYVLHARPKLESPRVFLIHTPPVRPFRYASTIARIVRCRLSRGGLNVSRGGAHLLRHCLATRLVSKARPINEVADLLGHRNMDATAIYVKVALPQLATVALPFPGGAA